MGRYERHKRADEELLRLPLEEAVVLGYNVEHLRRAQGISKTVFAQMAQISRPTLDKIERGECNAKLSMLRHLADALSVPSVYLLTPPRDPRSFPIISTREAVLRAFPADQQPDASA